ncbi:MAG: hypothetical protein HYT62_01755 [Candidatus Yanofskybacteria bacterium]|nr:hypothetical protein [Candidatus Yanofskybacteria bacterium]
MFLKRNKNYYGISVESDDWVAPEETLLDSDSQYSDIEQPISGLVFRLFMVVFSLVFLIILSFVFKNSIIDHDVFSKLAFQNKSANFPLPPPRGAILDRNGLVLVRNIPVFNLLAITRELKDSSEDLGGHVIKIAQILGQNPDILHQKIIDQMKFNSTFFVHLELTKDQALAIEYLDPKGFYVVPDTKREYLDGPKFSQIIGYTGKVSKDDLGDDYYFTTDVVGRLGIENQYEKFLRGVHGNIFFSRGEAGHITKEPTSGNSLILNIDHDLQVKLYDEVFSVLRDSGLSRAAAIVQDPRDGSVRALVSFPGFDNNIFSSSISEGDYRRLFENKSKPLFNRVVGGLYNPGSTIKPLVGMAGLQEKIMTPGDTIEDCVDLTIANPYDQDNPYVFKNWRVEYGPFNLRRAIANSCNIYFFTMGGGFGNINGLGAERLIKYFNASLIASALGLDMPGEEKGFVPSPEWKLREKGEAWYLGDTYNISIGQGDLLVTPLWLNSYVSAIANGGNFYKPLIGNRVVNRDQETVAEFNSEVIGSLPFSEGVINEVRNAMRETVLSGTAQPLKDLPVTAGAKTGTAEVVKGRSVNSFLIVFTPHENPELAMTILIEGASPTQQGLAIKVASEVLKWYFSRN